MKHDDTICFVCKPTWIMYLSAMLNDKMRTVRDNSITISKVIVYSPECIEHAMYISDERRQGVHWALLMIDLVIY